MTTGSMSVLVNVLLMGFLLHGAICEDFSVSLPQQLEAVRGSCLTIPCSFTVQDDHEINLNSGCRAVWRDATSTEVEFTRPVTEDLTQKNCTTTVYDITEQQGQQVYFRVECENALKWTFKDKNLHIKIRETPPTPILTPSTVSVSEGQSVSVQCSAPVPCLSLPPTLTWSPVLGHIQETLQEQPDKTYVTVSTLSFTASEPKTSLSCFAIYNREDGTTVSSAVATAQIMCDQCPKFSVSLPPNIKPLQGSCVTIPCSFQVENKFKTNLDSGCKAAWKDISDNTYFNTGQMGNLTQKNCSTTFHDIGPQHNQKYFFRLECNNSLKYTFKEAGVNIQVTEAPPTPTLTPPTVSVSEGQSVSVQCSAPVPCLSLPPTLTWSPVLGHIQETLQEQLDKTYVKVSTLSFTASHLHDKKNITCSAVYSKEDSSLSLTSVQIMSFVTYQPRNTSISPTGPVTEHSNMSLSCSSDANPAVQHYHWYKADGGTHTLMGNSSVLNMKASRDTTAIFCETQNELGTDNSTITFLTIQYPPRNTTVTLTPAGPVTEHSNITLNCSSDANPSVFHWYKADGGTHTLIGNSSVLNTKASRDTTAIFCEVQNHLGTDRSVVKQLDVQFPPQIMSSSNCSGDSAQMSCVCETEGNPFPLIQWSFPGVSPNISISSEPLSDKALKSVITVIKPQWRDPVTLVCHSRNSLGSDTQSFSAHALNWQDRPKNTRVTVSPSGPVTEHSNMSLSCSSDANPAVQHYHWYKADGGTHTLIGNSSVLNMKASRDTTAIFCEAQNELGIDHSSIIELDVQYPPQNTTVTVHPSGPVEEYSHVTLTCHSEANPAVKHYHWYKDDNGTYTLIGHSAVLNITASKDTTRILCETLNDLGTDHSSLTQMNVIYKPRNTRVTVSPSGPVTEHSNMSLSCSSDANPAVQHYHWYKADGGTHTLIGKSSVLNMKASRDTTAIFCEAQNELGADHSSIFDLDVQYLPQNTTVTVHPSGPVEEYSHVTLTCHSEANPAVKHYHWYKDDNGTYTLIGHSVVVNIIASKETTTVFCETQNDLGTDRSSVTQLPVKYKPRNTTVTVSPSGPVTEHSNMSLSCSSDANPAVQHYHWYKVDGGTHTLIGNSSVLNMKASRDTTAIFCEAQNELGNDHTTVTDLDIQFPSQIMSFLNCSGNSAQMSCVCETEGNPFPLIQWSFPGVSPNISISSEPLSDKALRSVISVPQWSDPVTLVCHSSNSLGSDSQSFSAHTLHYQPLKTRVTVSPSGPVTEHSNMSLSCSSDANPAVQHYHWYKADGGTHTLIGNSSALNMKASRDTTAIFCEAQNELGADHSSIYELDVQYPPQNTTVTVHPSGPVEEYSHVTLTCHSEANPAVKHYHWYKDDNGTYTLIGHSAVLNITASKNTTRVFCETQNDLGTDHSPLTQLPVKYKPGNTRVTVSPSGPVTEHSNMSLSCSSDANPGVQHYHWYKADGGTHTLIGNSSVLNIKASRDTTAIFCEAQNELGTDNYTVTELQIQFPAQILSSSNCSGDSARMSCVCETEGNPFPLIQWSLPEISSNHSISSEPLSDKALRSVITVIKPQWRDPVTLVCHSSNSLGSDRRQLDTQAFQPVFQQAGVGKAVINPFLVAIILILLALMAVLLYVIRTQNVRLNKRQSSDVALDQITQSEVLSEYVSAKEMTAEEQSEQSTKQ
ncbi:hypothetical protein NQD34_011783 [Periophthalmus magnuspinnatus]|nr:hypothetical protein NQD34_011783 [Periophthalmus magnuspinnatus]